MTTALFIADSVLVLLSAAILALAARRDGDGVAGTLAAAGVLFTAAVAGPAVLLGAVGGLGAAGFLAAHALLLLALGAWRRGRLRVDLQAGRELARQCGREILADGRLRWGLVAAGLFLLVTAFLAAASEPAILDALTYRLSRVAQWLQDGRVGFLPTNDPRQNYMPVVPDLVMAWLLGATRVGFAGAALAQWGGGVLLLVATVGLAREAGLGRPASLGAALTALGMANVAGQFTTDQTDLFTAGLVAAAVFLLGAAARRGRGSVVAGLAAGLAVGSKGTVFYLGPTLVLWVAWYAWSTRLPARPWLRTCAAAALSALAFVAPGMVRNRGAYGGVFGPPAFVTLHHQGGLAAWPAKASLNLWSSGIQSLEPHSQAPGLGGVTAAWGLRLAAGLPAQDPYAFEGYNRREVLAAMMVRRTPDADGSTMGLLPLVLLLGAAAATLLGSRGTAFRDPREARVVALGLLLFAVFFHGMQQWHPFGFRYFIIVVPWVCILIAGFLQALSRRLRAAAWGILMASSALVAWHTLADTHNAGWPAFADGDRSVNSYVYRAWRAWLGGLGPPGGPLRVALPFDHPLASFYRLPEQRAVEPVPLESLAGLTAEQAVAAGGGGWLVTTRGQFAGREGRVVIRTWLFRGSPDDPHSLVAYRSLGPGD